MNGQTAWALLTKAERFRVHMITKLEDEDVRRMGMVPTRSVQEALAKIPKDTRGYIMPRGATLLPLVG